MKNNTPLLIAEGPAIAEAGLIHRVHKPDGQGPHPTAVMLHGRSGDEDNMWIFARNLPSDWLLIAPRAIKADPAGGYSWQPRQKNEWPSLATFDDAVTAVVKFVNALPHLYQADPDHIYLMGFSQGAATAYATAFHHPQLAKGIAGLVGFVPTDAGQISAEKSLAGIPIFMAVGREDEWIPLEQAQRCAEALRAAGADLDYREYDTGHRLNAQGMRDLKEWWAKRTGTTTSP